jgi:hypothetical protein
MRLRRTIPAPRRVSLPWLSAYHQQVISANRNNLLKTQGKIFAMAGKIPAAAMKTPKYRAATDLEQARITYPTPPTIVRTISIRPLCCVLSAIQVVPQVSKNDRKKGGAVNPCAFTAEKPISLRIVGRKTGREEKLTLQLKYIS